MSRHVSVRFEARRYGAGGPGGRHRGRSLTLGRIGSRFSLALPGKDGTADGLTEQVGRPGALVPRGRHHNRAASFLTRRIGMDDSIEATPSIFVSLPVRNVSNSLRSLTATRSR